ncbi:hypothetical protein LCGC14_1896890 [marine sediment metagenome]|uniref:Uncharacterized protein n=1 Tax=marine sediment metagenome TaxID=412755 RepID=A0A0F9IVU6_9ZZZZ
MSKHNKGSHGVYSLTCISRKCGRRFGVMWEGQTTKFYNYFTGGELGSSFKLTYPFTGCPWCGAWWCTGPLDAAAYPAPPPLLGHRHVVRTTTGSQERVFKCGTWWPVGPLDARALPHPQAGQQQANIPSGLGTPSWVTDVVNWSAFSTKTGVIDAMMKAQILKNCPPHKWEWK